MNGVPPVASSEARIGRFSAVACAYPNPVQNKNGYALLIGWFLRFSHDDCSDRDSPKMTRWQLPLKEYRRALRELIAHSSLIEPLHTWP